jgi:mRNA (2'-O-methyladenosine-N6-)-methyltransferase
VACIRDWIDGDHVQFASQEDEFEPICDHITKESCAKARSESDFYGSTVCDRVSCEHVSLSTNRLLTVRLQIHFRPLIRPHTDPSLGHCSYLNTCYSEPTYALSPSIPPFPSNSNRTSSVSLPSGLGAGGRGKEKAPCRYLHFEVDYDGTISDAERERRKERNQRANSHPERGTQKLSIGLGPLRKLAPPVC